MLGYVSIVGHDSMYIYIHIIYVYIYIYIFIYIIHTHIYIYIPGKCMNISFTCPCLVPMAVYSSTATMMAPPLLPAIRKGRKKGSEQTVLEIQSHGL